MIDRYRKLTIGSYDERLEGISSSSSPTQGMSSECLQRLALSLSITALLVSFCTCWLSIPAIFLSTHSPNSSKQDSVRRNYYCSIVLALIAIISTVALVIICLTKFSDHFDFERDFKDSPAYSLSDDDFNHY